MSQDKDMGKLLLVIVFTVAIASYVFKNPIFDVALAVIMFFALIIAIRYILRKPR